MSPLSYAAEREANIARNRRLLMSFDMEKLRPETEPKETRHKNQKKPKFSSTVGIKRKAVENSDTETDEKPYAKTRMRVVNDENAVPQPGQSMESRRRSSRIAGKPVDAMTRVELSRGVPQPISVKALVEDGPQPVKHERRHNP